GKLYRDVVKELRRRIPGCVIRMSLITGFPGETENEHRERLEFLKEAKLERVGVFMYSREDGTPAAKMKNQVHAATKKRRFKELMAVQQNVSREFNNSRVGKVFPVIIDSVSDDGIFYVGRTYMEAPEEDGNVYFVAKDEHSIGDVLNVKVLLAEEYDVTGEECADSD
ncbi:MAG: 30S ribosomal protein S12 methylthiotransferase RimO, partial [Clostridia bacterium]|nr:30S ribosomal protein S12 methylthiotransferase RimO [Clostridia bacterium]